MTARRLIVATFIAGLTFVSGTTSAFGSGPQIQIRDVDSRAFPVVSMTVLLSGNAHASDISVEENGAAVRSPRSETATP